MLVREKFCLEFMSALDKWKTYKQPLKFCFEDFRVETVVKRVKTVFSRSRHQWIVNVECCLILLHYGNYCLSVDN